MIIMNKRTMRTYDEEFKLNAVKLCLESDCTRKQIAKELGLPVSTLAEWIKAYKNAGNKAFPGKGHIKDSEAELIKLRKELAIAREERDILKKALGIFSSTKK